MKKRWIAGMLMLTMLASFMVVFPVSAKEGDVIFHYSFETDTEKWALRSEPEKKYCYGTDLCASDGNKALLFCDDSLTASGGIRSEMVEAKPGEVYTATADTYGITGFIDFQLVFYDGAKKTVSFKSMRTANIGVWKNFAITGETPEDAAYVGIVIATYNGSIAGAFYDNVKLIEGSIGATEAKGTIPKEVPVIEAPKEEVVPPTEDGVADQSVIYSTSFESGVNDWDFLNDESILTVSEETKDYTDGYKSLYIKDDSKTLGPGIISPIIPVSQGNTYTVTLDLKGVLGRMFVYTRFVNQSGGNINNESQEIELSDWRPTKLLKKAPKDAVGLRVLVCGINAATGAVYVDNVKVYKGDFKIVIPEREYIAPVQRDAKGSSLVVPKGEQLTYPAYNAQGDAFSDFSYAGFAAGKYDLPETENLPVVMELSPTGTEDDTKHIQDAIDKIYHEAANDNFKVLKLKAGKYFINQNGIQLKSGILLSGEGQGPTGTILYAKDPQQYPVISISGEKVKKKGRNALITDDYVKAGSNKINLDLESVGNFKAGDKIIIYAPSTKEWVDAIGMTKIQTSTGNDNSWYAGAVDVSSERTIVSIDGTELTLDFPMFFPLEKKYAQSYVYKIDDTGYVQNAGVENIRFESYYNGKEDDEAHATQAVKVGHAKDIFVRNLTANHFVHGVISVGGGKQVTVQNCSSINPVSLLTGSRRYTFGSSGRAQQVLFTGNYAHDGRHDYVASGPSSSPIAFVDNVADSSNNATETHGTWSTGVLYDNIYQIKDGTEGTIAFRNRGIFGSDVSQGWSAAGGVMWNCLAPAMYGHKPPLTYQNFMIGVFGTYEDDKSLFRKTGGIESIKREYLKTGQTGGTDENFKTVEKSPMAGDCFMESELNPVEPRSLFKAQLAERITGSFKNARANAPIIVYPGYDKHYEKDENTVTISGAYQKGAEAVTVYIDDEAHKATLNKKDNTFGIDKALAEGVHKIYATQTIDGVEGNKTADRFVIIGEAKGNAGYLQSIYPVEKTRMLVNDPRMTYDAYQKTIDRNKITVLVNGATLQSDVEPYETNGRVLVPMRAIFEEIGAEVFWDEATATATALKESTEVKITENDTKAYVNGQEVILDVPATITQDRFVVPVRFISESFGCEVGWLDLRKTVTIEGGIAIKYPALHNMENMLDIYDAVQSGDDGSNSIANLLDGLVATRWAVAYDAEKPEGAYGIFDLGAVREIEKLYISFFGGKSRVYTLDIYVSDDNEAYTKVTTFKSSGKSTELEEVAMNTAGRYLKIVGKGSDQNQWNSLTELVVIGK